MSTKSSWRKYCSVTVGASMLILSAVAVLPSASSASGTGIPAAQAALKKLEIRPTKIPVSTPVAKHIPGSKTIDFVVCGVPQCAILTGPLEAAAADLGWTVDTVPGGLTPETVLDAWNQVVQNKPNAAVATGFPEVLFSAPLATLASEHIPVVNGFVTDTAGNGVSAIVNGAPAYTKAGSALANFVLGTDGTTAHADFIGSTTFPASGFEENAFKSRYAALCPSCKIGSIDEPSTITQADLTAGIVAAVTADPTINYIVCSSPTDAYGLPQALSAAGFTHVKILVNTPDATTLTYLKQGLITGIIDTPNTDVMAEFIDALARTFTGQSVAVDQTAGSDWAVTKATAGQVVYPYHLVNGFLKQYEALWNAKKPKKK
jgi:ABC-type sugar transport system substrate-binding protein